MSISDSARAFRSSGESLLAGPGIKIGRHTFTAPTRLDAWKAPRSGGVYVVMSSEPKKPELPFKILYVRQTESFIAERIGPEHHAFGQWFIMGLLGHSMLYVSTCTIEEENMRRNVEIQLVASFMPQCNVFGR
jgi:hypothetical protein